jgi:hypothetical protein
VDGFEDDGGADRAKFFHQGVGDLGGQSLLHLGAAGVAIDEAGELAEADDFAIGEIGHVRPASEGEQVVFAEGVEFNIAEKDDLIVSFVEDGFEMRAWVLVHAGHQFGIGAGDAAGGFAEAFAVGVFADGDENLADGAFDTGVVDARAIDV